MIVLRLFCANGVPTVDAFYSLDKQLVLSAEIGYSRGSNKKSTTNTGLAFERVRRIAVDHSAEFAASLVDEMRAVELLNHLAPALEPIGISSIGTEKGVCAMIVGDERLHAGFGL